jgi:triosephosphate isomerase
MSADDDRRLVVGNWKMMINHDQGRDLIRSIASTVDKAAAQGVTTIVLPSFTAIHPVCQTCKDCGSRVLIGAQTVSDVVKGAYTGDVSAPMLAALGCKYVLVGHSERRRHHHEDDACIRRKLRTVIGAGMTPILCVGESAEAHENGLTGYTIIRQLQVLDAVPGHEDDVIIAYEPIWAIGSGQTASRGDIDHVIDVITDRIVDAGGSKPRVLYGGSVNAGNADDLASIGRLTGVLAGGASVQANPFRKIITAFSKTGQDD